MKAVRLTCVFFLSVFLNTRDFIFGHVTRQLWRASVSHFAIHENHTNKIVIQLTVYLFRLLSVTCHNTVCVMFVCVSHISKYQQLLFFCNCQFSNFRVDFIVLTVQPEALFYHFIIGLLSAVGESYEIKIHHEPYGFRCALIWSLSAFRFCTWFAYVKFSIKFT